MQSRTVGNYQNMGNNFIFGPQGSFMAAAAAGVFVSVPAQNYGYTTHHAPWITTVGMSTHPTAVVATLTVCNTTADCRNFTSARSLSDGFATSPLVRGADIPAAGYNATKVSEPCAIH